jgi:hypothetical protein
MADTIQEFEAQGDMENSPHLVRARRMLEMQRLVNERHRRRQAEITRQATLEMQGSGVLAGMGFATYVR